MVASHLGFFARSDHTAGDDETAGRPGDAHDAAPKTRRRTVSPRGRGIAWYRFRATFGARRGGYLGVVVLIGLIGGLAMASIAAGRLTQSSYPTFLASTNPSDLTVSVFGSNSGGAVASIRTKIAHLPDVERVRDLIVPTIVPLAKNGAPRLGTMGDVTFAGSLDGMFLRQDRLTAIEGRLADPNRADEIVMTAPAARLLGVHLGQVVPLGFYTRSQATLPGFGTPRVAPRLRIQATLTAVSYTHLDVYKRQDQVLQLVAVDLGLLVVFEVAVLDPPRRDGVDDPVDDLLERVLALGGAERSAEVLLGQDVGGVRAPGLGHLDVALLERDRAVAIVHDPRLTELPANLLVGVDAFGREVPTDADSNSLRGDGHLFPCSSDPGSLVPGLCDRPLLRPAVSERPQGPRVHPQPQYVVVASPVRHEMLGFITAL